MAWCRQASSKFLNQCWLRSVSPNDVIRLDVSALLFWQILQSYSTNGTLLAPLVDALIYGLPSFTSWGTPTSNLNAIISLHQPLRGTVEHQDSQEFTKVCTEISFESGASTIYSTVPILHGHLFSKMPTTDTPELARDSEVLGVFIWMQRIMYALLDSL